MKIFQKLEVPSTNRWFPNVSRIGFPKLANFGMIWDPHLAAGQQGRQRRGSCDRDQLHQGQRHPLRHEHRPASRAIAQPAQGTQGLAVAAVGSDMIGQIGQTGSDWV